MSDDDRAEFWQQVQQEELEQWLAEQKEQFNKIFGKVEKDEHTQETK